MLETSVMEENTKIESNDMITSTRRRKRQSQISSLYIIFPELFTATIVLDSFPYSY